MGLWLAAPGSRRGQKMGLGSQISITGSCSDAQGLILSCVSNKLDFQRYVGHSLFTLINNAKLCPNVIMIGINGCQGPIYFRRVSSIRESGDITWCCICYIIIICGCGCKENLKFDILLSKNNSKRHTSAPS